MYKCIAVLFTLLLAGANGVWAQSGLHFDNMTLDFGHIAEDGGVVSRSIVAHNRGDSPIVIVDVVTACGCTTASFSRKPIAPGSSFTLDISYNPMNRPGRIDRRISVVVSDDTEPITLRLAGYVTPRERSVYEIYPFDMGGGLRLESSFHAFACIEHGKMAEVAIGYCNTSASDIDIEMVMEHSSGLLHIEMPSRIAAGERGDLRLRYATDEGSQVYGSIGDCIRLYVDGKAAQYPITTYAVVVDNFDQMDDISAPRLEISEKNIKFGDVKPSYGSLERSFTIRNSGGSTLILRRVEASHSALECNIGQDIRLEKGESLDISVRLDVGEIEHDEPFASRLQIICNDPIRPLQMVRVTALPL